MTSAATRTCTHTARAAQPIVVTAATAEDEPRPYVRGQMAGRMFGAHRRSRLLSSLTRGSRRCIRGRAGDYRVLPSRAAAEAKPILVGVSEGAGLSLLAATDPRTRQAIAGVLGLGLPDLNELGWHWRDALIYLTHGTPNEPLFSTARLASQVAPLPLAAIHATHDEFAPLAEVQRIVAAAGEPKRLWIIDAADHRFSDALPSSTAALRRSHGSRTRARGR